MLEIVYKLDMEALHANNTRETLETVIPTELHIWETHEKTFARKETAHG